MAKTTEAGKRLKDTRKAFNQHIKSTMLYFDTNPYMRDPELLRPITLLVGGRIVRGTPVTVQQWLALHKELAKAEIFSVGQASVEKRAAEIVAAHDAIEALPEDEELDEEQLADSMAFSASMYLKDGQVLESGNWIPATGHPMAVSYASVDAFWYGLMGDTPPADPEEDQAADA